MKVPPDFTREDRMAARWIVRMAAGDAEGLNALYALYHRKLLGMLSGIVRDAGSAEEVLQDLFVRAYRQADRYDPELGIPFAWLATIGKRLAIDRLRQQRRKQEIILPQREHMCESGDKDIPDGGTTLYDGVEKLWIRESMGELTPSQQEVIELAFVQGFTHMEIAEALDRPLGTVKSDLRRGLMQLRKLYLERDDG